MKLVGFWSMETAERFATELVAMTKDLRSRGKSVSMLSDGTDFPVQATDVAMRFAQIMNDLVPITDGRMAIVASSTLNKLQAERIFTHSRFGIFLDEESALAWIQERKAGE